MAADTRFYSRKEVLRRPQVDRDSQEAFSLTVHLTLAMHLVTVFLDKVALTFQDRIADD